MKAEQGDYQQAIRFYEKTISIEEKSIPLPLSSLVNTYNYNNMSGVYAKLHDYTNAIVYSEKSLTIKQQILPANHHDLAVTYNRIGLTHENMNDYSKAHASYKLAIEIAQVKKFKKKFA